MSDTTSLRDAVTAARDHITDDPPTPAGVVAAFGPPDPQRILQIIGLNPQDPKAHAVVAVAERYGLDPVLGHIQIIGTSRMPYITRDGFLFIAHRSGQLDGIEVVDGPRRDGADREWVARVAVYRKDMARPFIYPGRAGLERDNGPEMALARAERRALRRAFAVTLPRDFAEDEYDTRPGPGPVGATGSPGPTSPGSEATGQPPARGQSHALKWSRKNAALQAAFKERGITDRAERLAVISGWVGHKVTTFKELTEDEQDESLARIADTGPWVNTELQPEQETSPPAQPSPAGGEAEAPAYPQTTPITRAQQGTLIKGLAELGLTDPSVALGQIGNWLGRDVARSKDLTLADYELCMEMVGEELAARAAHDQAEAPDDYGRPPDQPDD